MSCAAAHPSSSRPFGSDDLPNFSGSARSPPAPTWRGWLRRPAGMDGAPITGRGAAVARQRAHALVVTRSALPDPDRRHRSAWRARPARARRKPRLSLVTTSNSYPNGAAAGTARPRERRWRRRTRGRSRRPGLLPRAGRLRRRRMACFGSALLAGRDVRPSMRLAQEEVFGALSSRSSPSVTRTRRSPSRTTRATAWPAGSGRARQHDPARWAGAARLGGASSNNHRQLPSSTAFGDLASSRYRRFGAAPTASEVANPSDVRSRPGVLRSPVAPAWARARMVARRSRRSRWGGRPSSRSSGCQRPRTAGPR